MDKRGQWRGQDIHDRGYPSLNSSKNAYRGLSRFSFVDIVCYRSGRDATSWAEMHAVDQTATTEQCVERLHTNATKA